MEDKKAIRKHKWENFWYYHKWHVVIAIFILVAVGSFVYEKLSAPDYDYHVAYVNSKQLSFEEEDALTKALEACGKDLDGNGKVKVEIVSYVLDSGDSADPSQQAATQTRFAGDLEMGTSMIYIYSDEIYKDYKSEGIFPEKESERYRLGDSKQKIPDELGDLKISMIQQGKADDSGKDKREKYYDNSEKLLKNLMK